ncbi:hypothetical protein [Erwinia tasmaniensis]|uniref:hypothetical protein n=1 Tax=Erwinia tasmaniensis TaxID=338565 RepID=UPI003A4D4C30
MTGTPQRCGTDEGPGEGSRDAALRERRAGRPLATGPSGLESEPKAPREAWREDARQAQGCSPATATATATVTATVTAIADTAINALKLPGHPAVRPRG